MGKIIDSYGVNFAELLVTCGVLVLIGGGVLFYGISGDDVSILWTIIGGGILFLALALAGYNALNIGRRLEVCKRGIRFTEAGILTEFAWDDVVDIDISRLDETNLGMASVEKRSNDAVSSSGLLTKTEWDVTIHARDGRRIRLKPMFFRIIPDPKKLINQIRLAAGTR